MTFPQETKSKLAVDQIDRERTDDIPAGNKK